MAGGFGAFCMCLYFVFAYDYLPVTHSHKNMSTCFSDKPLHFAPHSAYAIDIVYLFKDTNFIAFKKKYLLCLCVVSTSGHCTQ